MKNLDSTVEVSFNLTLQDLASLQKIAIDEHISPTFALRKAVAALAYIREKQKSGSKFFIQEENGTIKSVDFH